MKCIIRFYIQDYRPFDENDLEGFLLKNGYKLIKYKYSSFGACFFCEVQKIGLKNNSIIELVTKDVESFNFNDK